MDDLYRFENAESKYDNEIAPSSTTFERGAFELHSHIPSKIYIR